jgi:AcrR family transcriptional regulator
MTEPSRTRGRPRVGDPEAMSGVGLRLIRENGWTATTMGQIAQACDVSSPTLFRYFPTKAALLWHGMDENEALFREAFAERAADQPLVDAIMDAYLAMMRRTTHLPLIKARMAVVVRDTDASQATWSTHEHWRELVIGLAAEYRGDAPESLRARVVGASIWAVLWAAVTDWAVGDDDDPAEHIAAARAMVTIALR